MTTLILRSFFRLLKVFFGLLGNILKALWQGIYRRISDWVLWRQWLICFFGLWSAMTEFFLFLHIMHVLEKGLPVLPLPSEIIWVLVFCSCFLFCLSLLAFLWERETHDSWVMFLIFGNPIGILFYLVRVISPWLQRKTASWWWQDQKVKKERSRIELERINFVGDIISSRSDIAKEYERKYKTNLYNDMLAYQSIWTYCPLSGALARVFLDKSFIEHWGQRYDVRFYQQELSKRILLIAAWKLKQALKIKKCLSDPDDDSEGAAMNVETAEKTLETLLNIFKIYGFDIKLNKEDYL